MKRATAQILKTGLAGALLASLSSPALADPTVIHGTVRTEDGRELTGVISWDGEEQYWLQHFNGRSRDPVDLSMLDKKTRSEILDRQPGPQLEIGSTTIELVKWFSDPELRPTDFSIEFGAIDRLEIDRGTTTVQLRDGRRLVSNGGSNDIGADLVILAADSSEREIDWDDVESVEFSEAPAGHPTFPAQLFGVAETKHGQMRGVMAWDSDERVATEMLDGDNPQGDEVSLEFGNVVSIESKGDASLVVAGDGRELLLNDSNDVDNENRGLIIVSPVFGRITVDWDDFEKVTFEPLPDGFLPDRSAWQGLGALRGEVRVGGEAHNGELMYDVDESTPADCLDGYIGKSRVWIPFRLVREIVPGENASQVRLSSGASWAIERNRDVDDTNNGIVVAGGGDHRYFSWEMVERVTFTH